VNLVKENILSSPVTAKNHPEELKLWQSVRLGGIGPFSTIDYPGYLAGVFFLQGCLWRCRYCHNPEFWRDEKAPSQISAHEAIQFLKKHQGLLDGIVFSGGEPTLCEALRDLMGYVKKMGYRVALHTAGMNPLGLRQVIDDCDWVGMDVKGTLTDYEKITRVPVSEELLKESISILVESGVSHEVRTTVHPNLHTDQKIIELAQELQRLGIKNYVLQAFRSEKCPDKLLSSIQKDLESKEMVERLQEKVRPFFDQLTVRL